METEFKACIPLHGIGFCLQSRKHNFEHFNIDEVKSCVRACVCAAVYHSQAIPRKNIQVIIDKLGTVTASDLKMHHV